MNNKTLQKLIFLLFLIFGGSPFGLLAQETPFPNTDPDWPTHPFTPGDGVFISTFPDTSSFLNGTFAIDDRGYVELPMAGKVKISTMTIDEFVNFLKKNFESYTKYPNFYVKPVVRVSLLGGFVRPGLYYVDVHSSLWDVIHLAGGTLTEDGIYEMEWQRNKKNMSSHLVEIYEKGISLKNMGFKSGDIFWTPSPTRRRFWDTVRDVMPILTFATSIWAMYTTYQRDVILLRAR